MGFYHFYIYIYIFNVFVQPPNITGRGYGTKEGHGPRRLPRLSPGRSLAALAAGGRFKEIRFGDKKNTPSGHE
jgi:hypothetical protein